MKIILLTPMDIEQEKALNALARMPNLQNDYEVIVSGIGRESTAKTLMQLPQHDVCVLVGFLGVLQIFPFDPPFVGGPPQKPISNKF